ncbi:glycosyltransferase family 4 protein [Nitriliruptoraceae bacterium ZYF776]|nr:glycosyltransferase family 4 protein [Profundirhabdus halotolerans]
MRVLVVTTVHTPLDARIHTRQIGALVAHGAEVTYAAPWGGHGVSPADVHPGVRVVELPRAQGRRRLAALRAARRLLATAREHADVVLLHDPELLLAVVGQRGRLPAVVLDVHEDAAASLIDRPWVPTALRPAAAWAARAGERWADRHLHLLLAEASYQDRFRRPHAFVPNVPPLADHEPPPAGDDRVVYVGRIAVSRGARELLALAPRLRDEGVTLELVGPPDADVRADLEAAVARGELRHTGFLPNAAALERVEGALAGLSLVHPQPNHAGTLQSKLPEYLSRRVPVITTDLPVAGAFVREHGVGCVVPTGEGTVPATLDAVRRLRDDADARHAAAERGYALVRDELNWDVAGARFVAELERVAGTAA